MLTQHLHRLLFINSIVAISEEKLGKYFATSFKEVVLPALEDMETRLKEEIASKEDVEELKKGMDTLNRKFDAQQDRLDRHGKSIEKLERKTLIVAS